MEMSEFSKRLSVDINVKSSRTVSWGSSTLKVQDDANKLQKKKKKKILKCGNQRYLRKVIY